MKQKHIVTLLMGGLLLVPAVSSASWWGFDEEEKTGKNWAVNVGTRVWVNEWETNRKGGFNFAFDPNAILGTISSHNEQVSSKSVEATPIPTASIRYGRFFVTGSHYTNTSFQFDDSRFINAAALAIPGGSAAVVDTWNVAMKGKRSEWDTSFGYYVIPNLAFTVGYKEISMNTASQYGLYRAYLNSAGGAYNWIGSGSVNSNNKFSGPIAGLTASLPFGDTGFGLYGSYVHGWLDWKYNETLTSGGKSSTNTAKRTTADYDLVELGVNYIYDMKKDGASAHLPINAATVFAGYRFQRLSYNIDMNNSDGTSQNNPIQKATDTTQGFAAGVNFSF